MGYDAPGNYGTLNDLWKYSISTNQWTWIGGSDINDQTATYGIMGTAAAANIPGGRYLSMHWADASGNLWLFGGSAFDPALATDYVINDLWKYNIAANQWTWVSGNNSTGHTGTYGTMGTAATTNIPGARLGGAGWSDASGTIFIFGGFGLATTSNEANLNDLWQYSTTTNQWAWTRGSNATGQSGVYGTQGISAPTNHPGARGGIASWTDAAGNFWLFGGTGVDAAGNMDDLNDLWKLGGCVANLSVSIAASDNTVCLGGSLSFTATGASTYAWSTNQTGSVIAVSPTLTGAQSLTCFPLASNGCQGTATTTAFDVYSLPVIHAGVTQPVSCSGAPVTLTVSGASSYNWVANSATLTTSNSSITFTPVSTSTYVVTGTDMSGCKNTATVTQNVSPCNGIQQQSKAGAEVVIYPNPNNGAFSVAGSVFGEHTQLVMFDMLGQKVLEENLITEETTLQTHLQKGVYYYTILHEHKQIRSGKILVN